MALSIALTGVLILALMSVLANRRFVDLQNLPMQWSLTGRVNWSAPRAMALAFTPLLALVVLFAAATGLAGDIEVWGVAVMAAAFVGLHLLHLWLVDRWARRQAERHDG